MRRFELEAEQKFWQIAIVDGATVRWSFGKIGSNGQTKLKKCADEATAVAELNRLVTEKKKQGFVERGPSETPKVTHDAAMGAPKKTKEPEENASPKDSEKKPAQREAPTTTITPRLAFEERVVFTEASARADKSRPGGHRPKPPTFEDATRALIAAYPSLREDWRLALMKWQTAGTEDLRVALEGYLGRHGGAPPSTRAELDLELEAIAATMTRYDARDPYVSRWLALGGVELGLEILARMWSYHQCYESTAGTRRPAWLTRVDPQANWDSSVCSAKRDVAERLAQSLSELEAEPRARAQELARKLRERAPLPVRIGLACAVDDPALANEDAHEVLATPRGTACHDAKWLMRVVDDPIALEGLVGRFGFDYSAFRPELVVRHVGVAAAPLLCRQLSKAGSRAYEIDVATYLATLECMESANALAPLVATKGTAAIARELFERRPDLAFAALGSIVAGRGKAATVIEPFVKTLLIKHVDLFQDLAKKQVLEPRVVAALRALGALPEHLENPRVAGDDEGVAGRLASADELPSVLVDPPWSRPATATAADGPLPLLEKVSPLPFEEAIILTPEERAVALTPSVPHDFVRRWANVPSDLAPRTHEMDVVVRDRLFTTTQHVATLFDLMSDDAVRAWMKEPAEVNAKGIQVETRDVVYLLARFGRDAIDFVLSLGRHSGVRQVVRAAIVISSPRVAAFMAEALVRTKAVHAEALAYLEEHSEAAAIALIPLALAKRTQKWARPALQVVDRSVVLAIAARHGGDVEAALPRLLDGEDETTAVAATPPSFVEPRTLPAVLLGSGKRLPNTATMNLVMLLMRSHADRPHPRLRDVTTACTRDSLARFAWGLFQAWLSAGGDPKHDWVMHALGALGDDDVARRITPLVRAWPGESLHARAVKGLDVLAAIGSDVALMNLDAIADKIKFQALKEKARQKIEMIAETRGLSREQLADRIAPTLDLDSDGSRSLAFGEGAGARTFRVGFDENLVPFVISSDGSRLGDLPKPRASDDAGIAAETARTWKVLKKDAKAIAESQIRRLERAMCAERRFTAEELRTLFIGHPLIFHLVRRLVWATFTEEREVLRLFRVAEDRSLADVDDEVFSLDADAAVGIPHRVLLREDDVRAWGDLFTSYEILQPFPQLGREVYRVAEDERTTTELVRYANLVVDTRRVLGLTSGRGWRFSGAGDGGWIYEVNKELLDGSSVIIALDGGLLAGQMSESPPVQKLLSVRLAGGRRIGDLPPIAYSELARDLESLRD